MKRNILLIILFTILITVITIETVAAQDIKKLTLQEAITLSSKNSKELKFNKAKIDEATAVVKEATDRRLPDAGINASYLYLPFQPNLNLKTKQENNGSSNAAAPAVSQAMYGIASVSLPVYAGGKLKFGIESARYLEQAVRADADNDREMIILNTINAYINLYKSKEAINLVKENLEQSRQRVRDLNNLEKNGLLARNDLLKAELQSSNLELSLLDAENNWKLASVNMALMLGLPEQTSLIPDENSLPKTDSIKTIEEYEQAALQNRKDISALSLRKKAADLGIRSVKADYYPSLALTAGYIALDVPKFVSVTNAVNVGVGFKYSLSSLWKTKAKVQQAAARAQQLQANEDMLTDNIRLEINQAYQNYLLSQKKILVYEKAVTQAAENFRITKNKYDNSLSTTTDVLDADVAALQAKLNYSFSKADAIASYNKLLHAAGLLNN